MPQSAEERIRVMAMIHERAQMTSSSINDLPDSAFAYIEPGGSKDSSGKTTPRSLRHFPIHDAAHVRNALARASSSSFGKKAMPKILAAAKKFGVETSQANSVSPLAIDVVRTVEVAPEYRSADGADDGLGLLTGRFSATDVWYPVDSKWEGSFLERVAPDAFAQSTAEHRDRLKVLFDHGFDPTIGNKVLGPIRSLNPDTSFEVPLFDTSYNRDLLPGLQAGVYGSSMRMRVVSDVVDNKPARSESNPEGVKERTITRAEVLEFGPVTFPANPGATAGVRSMTDQFYDQLRQHDSSGYEAAVRAVEQVHPDFTGVSDARSSGRGEAGEKKPVMSSRQRLDDGALRLRGIKL